MMTLFLSNCGHYQTDCMTLLDDRNAYRLCTANQGSKTSQYELGFAAFETQDYPTALKWLKRAAMVRAPQNYADLGPLDDRPFGNQRLGSTIPRPNSPSLPGHVGAQSLLAHMYQQGIGVKVDLSRAKFYKDLNKK